MLPAPKDDGSSPRSQRVFVICFLLLLASAINYMDRQTLAVVAKRITTEFQLNNEQYGVIEAAFGYSFAFGSLFWGLLVDRLPVRWVYPVGLLGWSAMGFLTGWARNHEELVICRSMLGFFEAAHWPCGLKTTQAILSQKGRAFGNSVLQSGTSIGAIATPLVMLAVLTDDLGSWRVGFQGIALVGALWVFLWMGIVRDRDFQSTASTAHGNAPAIVGQTAHGNVPAIVRQTAHGNVPAIVRQTAHGNVPATMGQTEQRPWWHDMLTRRFALTLLTVIAINTMWQLLRAWLPKIMQEHYGYGERDTLLFNSVWYAATDIGCFSVGAATLYLANRGWSIKGSRLTAMLVCALMVGTLLAAPWLQGGNLLLAILLVSGAGALGMFPLYYSFSQDVSRDHLGKVISLTSPLAWIASSLAQTYFGKLADQTGRFDIGLALVGMLPIVPLVALWLFWPVDSDAPIERKPL